ncbi:MAG TPA: TonB-dependent receptor [Vicinamibacterales bacterium]|nr:TonB-dependent receptor [Vicinamibacterales bacterium]
MSSPHVRVLAALLVVLASTAARAAGQTTSTLTGRVVDGSGGALPGALVTARHVETSLSRTTTTDVQGRYTFAVLPVGVWEVRAELEGFRPQLRSGVVLTVAQTMVVDFVLEIGGLTEEVRVTGGVSPVNVSTGDLSYLVSGHELEVLPLNGRNYTDLALLQPGVLAFPHREGGSVVAHGLAMSVNGQDPRSNVYLLDGTLLNDFTNSPAGSAAGTALGLETIREFRVETNAYGAEFGRNSGGHINAITKSGSNTPSGSAYLFHRNEVLDARNFFDGPEKPDFWRYQFGATLGGPIQRDRWFYFAGYEGLQEKLGRTIATFVPDLMARQGFLPDPSNPGQLMNVGVHPAVRPYLEEFPLPNGPPAGGGIASFSFPFDQRLDQHYAQGRIDYNAPSGDQYFARYTFDDAEQELPTDFPQFPRSFISRNQFFTGEWRRAVSSSLLNTLRLGFSRTRIAQHVEANTSRPLQPFAPGRLVGDIDIGGLPRFGPQISADVRLVQNVFSVQDSVVLTRGRHLIKAGGLVERYQMNMVNPTFSLGVFAFADLRGFLENRPLRFIGLTPEAQFDRYWRSTLFGAYVQDEMQASDRLSVTAGLRYETFTMPVDRGGRDATLISLDDREPTVGRLFKGPPRGNLSPRFGAAWDVFGDGRTSIRGGYGLYFNTQNQQNLIVTVTNPPATPRPVIANPTFPDPFTRGGSISIRPMQWDLQSPRVHVWNASVERELFAETTLMVAYAGSRGKHLLRSRDVNVAQPIARPDGTLFILPGTPRPNPAFTTIELKSSDGDSWYRALIIEVRRRWSAGLAFQSSYTWGLSEDTTQASTFFSDATNGTTSAFPEFVPGYNKGRSDFDVRHNWMFNFTWALPFAKGLDGWAARLLDGWQLTGIAQVRSGQPLTVFVASNRSRSLWAPSLGPGIGQDRPSYAPGRGPRDAVIGDVDQWFDPTAFVLQPAGTFGNTGRGDFDGPNLRTLDLALVKSVRLRGEGPRLDIRIEGFNVLNRANFGPPNLIVFAGREDNEAPLPTFGRIRSTVTSSRQLQLGVRLAW